MKRFISAVVAILLAVMMLAGCAQNAGNGGNNGKTGSGTALSDENIISGNRKTGDGGADSQTPDSGATPAGTDSAGEDGGKTNAEQPTPDGDSADTPEPEDISTEKPTEVPTENPAGESTETPTEEPAEVPTEEPAASPSAVPTEAPTASPSVVPAVTPTALPTAAPTEVPTPEGPPEGSILARRIDIVCRNGNLKIGESTQLEAIVYPDNYNYGTLRWKVLEGNGTVDLDPVTGHLTAVSAGRVGIIAYIEEYEVMYTPIGVSVIEPVPEPTHEQELAPEYRPEEVSPGNGWTVELLNIRQKFLIYNQQTPEELPVFTRGGTDYYHSPYTNDFTLYVSLSDSAEVLERAMDGTSPNNLHEYLKKHRAKVIFKTEDGDVVGYSYTNSSGIAMFTMKKIDILLRLEVELEGYRTSEFADNLAETGRSEQAGPYTNSGGHNHYVAFVLGDDVTCYRLDIIDERTGEEPLKGTLDITHGPSLSVRSVGFPPDLYPDPYARVIPLYRDISDFDFTVTYQCVSRDGTRMIKGDCELIPGDGFARIVIRNIPEGE